MLEVTLRSQDKSHAAGSIFVLVQLSYFCELVTSARAPVHTAHAQRLSAPPPQEWQLLNFFAGSSTLWRVCFHSAGRHSEPGCDCGPWAAPETGDTPRVSCGDANSLPFSSVLSVMKWLFLFVISMALIIAASKNRQRTLRTILKKCIYDEFVNINYIFNYYYIFIFVLASAQAPCKAASFVYDRSRAWRPVRVLACLPFPGCFN